MIRANDVDTVFKYENIRRVRLAFILQISLKEHKIISLEAEVTYR